MAKLVTFSELQKRLPKMKENKTVGLIIGCFDVIHLGHVDLFEFAKEHTDTLIIGIETDTSITLTKGKNRPINSQKHRAKLISSLSTVDYVFHLGNYKPFHSIEARSYYDRLLKKIKPHFLFTSVPSDKYHKRKKRHADGANTQLIIHTTGRNTSTTDTLKDLIDSEL